MKNRDPLHRSTGRSRWRAGFAALAVAGLVASASAQTANTYTFSTSTGATLNPMSGASTLIGSSQDDAASALTNIGFTFNYEGANYTQFSVNSNGGLKLGGLIGAGAINYNLTNNPVVLLPYSGDGTTSTGSVQTVLMGSSPNQVRIVQWNVGMDYNASAANCLYQVWLYETTKTIEFRYGSGAPTGTFSGGIQVAITGAIASNYLNVLGNLTATSTNTTLFSTGTGWPGNGTMLTFSPPAGFTCTTPAPGNTVASQTVGCAPMSVSLSLQNAVPGTGISYQWQSSPDGNAPWTNVGTDNATYAANGLNATTWFRCQVTCANGPVTVASNPVQVTVNTATINYYTYNGTQFTETFSTWADRCSSGDVPTGGYWVNTPAYGPGSWRISSVDGYSAGWGGTGGWNYPQNTWADAPMARFHNRTETPAGTIGTLDFYVNMSAGTGGEKVRFDYINGGDTFEVLVSTNGGGTFTSKGTITSPYGSFQLAEYAIGSTSATTVIRIKSTALGGNNNDSGVDNFRIIPTVTCTKPTSVAASVTGAGEANITWACAGCTGSYIVEYGPTGFTPGAAGTNGVNGTVVTAASSPKAITGIAAGNYQVYVRQDCGAGSYSENSTAATFAIVNGDFCANAIDIASLGLPSDDSSNPMVANTAGAQNDYTSSACGSLPEPDVVLYHDVAPGATLSFVAQGYNSKLSIAYGGACPGTNNLACGTGGYLTMGANVHPGGPWGDPTFTWTNTNCQTERVYVVADGGSVYMWSYSYTQGATCFAVTGITHNTANTGVGNATVSWNATCSGNVIVEYGLQGFTPGIGATAGVGGTAVAVSGSTTNLTGLNMDVNYDVYVRNSCGAGQYSANGTAHSLMVHNGDDCSRVIALSGASGSMVLNTTGANNDISACVGGNTGGDLIASYTLAAGDAIYFTTTPDAPYSGHVMIGYGQTCPGSTVLYCAPDAADYYWENTTGNTQKVFLIQDGTNEGSTTLTWELFPYTPPVCNGNKVVMNITTDGNPAQLTWVFTNSANAVVATGTLAPNQNNTTVSETVCLNLNAGAECYGFKLMDSFGDGITNGGWELRTTGGKLILADAFANGSVSPANPPATVSYGNAHSFCLPLGPVDILANECGIFNNALGNKVYCNKPAGATQYEFEFSDPDAGFLRRVTVNRNYVIFTELGSNITPGVKYFARVRTNVAGPLASAYWGSGCEMGLGVAQVVTCSELIMAPAYGHSCNESRAFNTNNSFIYAKPVNGANEYQFRIYNLNEGYDQTFTRSTYILQLKWNANVALPLVNGSTYNVQINTKVNGLYTGFCPSSCTISINNALTSLEQASAFGEATMWPNPVSDGQVNLSIGGLQDADQHISVDVQDLYGKQVFAQEFGNSGDRFNTILQLPGDIASGVYVVNITVNGQRTVQRLSIVK